MIVVLTAWLFADVLFRDQIFAYRDTAYLYYPLFRLVESEWAAGRVPLWNPLENCGTPLAAGGSASVFYPGQLLFWLPVGFDGAFRAYVVGHALLAAATSYPLARHWRASTAGAALAALSYAFGGCVLFQYCNLIYLVSAAWLPAAVLAIDRALVERSLRWAFIAGATLAMMILGGDPQTAYHALIVSALYAWLLRRADRTQTRTTRGRLAPLAIMVLATGTLAAVQILPSWEFTRRSDRAAFDAPRSAWELAEYAMRETTSDTGGGVTSATWYAGLLADVPRDGSHTAGIYQFSVSPWSLAELVWPNFAGRAFPVNRRWIDALPAEGRMWVPSFYLGTIPLALALAAFRLRHTTPHVRLLSWCVVLGVLASLGAYGPVWIAAELVRAAGGDPERVPVGGGFGGVYWFLNTVLPGYVQFRYPAKWLTVAVLGISQLAAVGWDAVAGNDRGRARRVFAGVALASGVMFAAACVIRPWWSGWLVGARPDPMFGPLDAAGAWSDLAAGAAQAAVVAAVGWVCLARRFAQRGTLLAGSLVLLTAVDLGVANRWFVLTAPAELWHGRPQLADSIDASRAYRAARWQPSRFAATSSFYRAGEAVAWDRESLWPRYNYAAGVGLVAVPGTVMPLDYAMFVPYLSGEARAWRDAARRPRTPALDLVGARYLIGPADNGRTANAEVEDVSLTANANAWPRVWVARQVEILAPIDETIPAVVRRRTQEVLDRLAHSDQGDYCAIVETETTLDGLVAVEPAEEEGGAAVDLVAIAADETTRITLDVELDRPALVVLADAFDPNWTARDANTGARLEIYRTNRVLRGVWLTAGRRRVVFEYRPSAFYAGAVASGAAWIALAVVGTWSFARRRETRRRE